jgi:hypothetical protein
VPCTACRLGWGRWSLALGMLNGDIQAEGTLSIYLGDDSLMSRKYLVARSDDCESCKLGLSTVSLVQVDRQDLLRQVGQMPGLTP